MSRHPIQALCALAAKPQDDTLIIAACGPKLYCCSGQSGLVLSEWSSENTDSSVIEPNSQNEPRGQKRKLGHGEINAIILLVPVPSTQRFIAVTGSDKCLRVFDTSQSGQIKELNNRCMPKRPCAVVTDSEGQTIFCADKFGDVYSLPLIYDSTLHSPSVQIPEPAREDTKENGKAFVPTATDRTVHTKRNRRALEDQLRSKAQKIHRKEPAKFDRELMLGHVSMLTDILHATLKVKEKEAQYLITADRDEHIRITRGPPQSHIIERFCLGHEEFVSRLCLIPDTSLLVSGGGDDWLGIWDWTTGKLLAKHDLVLALDAGATDRSGVPVKSQDDKVNIAVSGMWLLPSKDTPDARALLVAFEKGASALLYDANSLTDPKVRPTRIETAAYGFMLDVVSVGRTILVSFDSGEAAKPLVHTFEVQVGTNGLSMQRVSDSPLCGTLNDIRVEVTDRSALATMLYSIETLRKRDQDQTRHEE